MSHIHRCLCDRGWECTIDIIPAGNSQALCKEWPDSICGDGLGNVIEHATVADTEVIIKKLSKVDPLTVARFLSTWAVSSQTF